MTCTQSPSSSGSLHRLLSQLGRYQQDTCDRKREESLVTLGNYATIDLDQSTDYDERGRQKKFKETDIQRKERLEFIRRGRHARRLARKGCKDTPICEKSGRSVATKLHPARPTDFTNAVITIQRAYRAYRALRALNHLERRIAAASNPSHDPQAALSYLHARSAEHGSLQAFIKATPHLIYNSRVLHAGDRVAETLRRALDRAARLENEHDERAVWIHTARSGQVGRIGNHELQRTFQRESIEPPKIDYHHYEDRNIKEDGVVTVSAVNDYEWPDSNSDSDSSGTAEEDFELALGEPESADPHVFESRIAALRSLFSGSDQQKRWIARILAAPHVDRRERRSSVSKVPALLTITEDREREA